MRIVVTGGSGRVGKFVVAELAAAGHEVTSLDLALAPERVGGVRYMVGNVSHPQDVYGTLAYARPEAVVHMAAWSDPGIVPDARTYADNVAGHFNVLDASNALGVGRVILASSAQVYGFAAHDPQFAPVTEDHPLRPQNSYALSKIAGEDAADYFARRGLNVLTFRIMGVRAPQDLDAEIERALDDPQRDRFLLWTRTDARDIAIGCRQALEIETVESGIYNLSGAENLHGCETRDLFERFSPATDLLRLPGGTASGFCSGKARKAFGYEPRFVWSKTQRHHDLSA
ncbi:NAD(P)-dependent oxidoreductase [Pelagibacterium sp. 26DY04]|uniref:NAD-dependent epimerase/dehydratase family protein n=1 Tax=Pelagibacterium sp. 26DY04 TaxID=2967130 RepID=UPI00281534F2|nr:NAD(P)-dependent oxidoreductase [Pelagibacterium sp. 26DY04]WMT85927.1 NAD(P)-dependent oxidoreductase [Pelagibacterium sp. 26DY04]